jgi:hypothetical protein
MEDPERPHQKVALECWRLIKVALAEGEDVETDELIAMNLIEMACDSAAESARMALGHPPRGVS